MDDQNVLVEDSGRKDVKYNWGRIRYHSEKENIYERMKIGCKKLCVYYYSKGNY